MHDGHRIADDVYGWLESPTPDAMPAAGGVLIAGWAFARDAEITQIEAVIGGQVTRVPHGARREDVHAVYPECVAAATSGFQAFVAVPDDQGAPVKAFEVVAHLSDGRRVRLFRRRAATPLGRLVRGLRDLARTSSRPRERVPATTDAREWFERTAQRELALFLKSGAYLQFPRPDAPAVSVVIVAWNRADMLLRCLRSVLAEAGVGVEVIVVDNHSTDETPRLLARTRGVLVRTQHENVGFTLGANIGAADARGDYLLFLNSDAELSPGAISAALAAFARRSDAGVVGGKLVLPDGTLQEAGSRILADGSCEGLGRGRDPHDGAFDFERTVDFCSGAFLMTPRALFESLGGFDEVYRPAYYEDADYCVRVWKTGATVVYHPGCVVTHLEFGSSPSRPAAIALQAERRQRFLQRHGDWLLSREAGPGHAPSRWPSPSPTLMVVDDAWPDARRGAGFPRAAALLRAFVDLGWHVRLYPMDGERRRVLPADDGARIEVVEPGGPAHLAQTLRAGGYEALLVSRPHNMRYVRAALGAGLDVLGVPVVYDAEAIYAARERARAGLVRPATAPDEQSARAAEAEELALCAGTRVVVAVSEPERRRFMRAGYTTVVTVGHGVDMAPTSTPFGERRGLLFVGALDAGSPNEDSILFFVRDVLPRLQDGRAPVVLTVVGSRVSTAVAALRSRTVEVLEQVDDLQPLFERARVFVAPTRFSAGIPLKLIDAASRMVPIVATSALAEQLGWTNGRELLAGDTAEMLASAVRQVYDDADTWERLRVSAFQRVGLEHSRAAFAASVRGMLSACGQPSPQAEQARKPADA